MMQKNIGRVSIPLLISLISLSHLSETIYTTSLPDIANYFAITADLAQTSSSIYFVGFALGTFSWGYIADRLGRRPIMLLGLSIYLISTMKCVNVDSVPMLLALRFIQAYGISVGSIISQTMARDSYHGHELSYVFSTTALAVAFMPSLGPLLGGYIVEFLGWQYNFIFLSAWSFIVLIIALFKLPETLNKQQTAQSINYFAVFKSMLKDRELMVFAWIVGCFNGFIFGFYIEAPFIFIDKLNMHPSNYGKIGFALSAAFLLGASVNRYLVQQYVPANTLIKMGLNLSMFACTILLLVSCFGVEVYESKRLAMAVILVPMALQCFSHLMVIPHCLRLALENYGKVTGTAGAILGGLYYTIIAAINYIIALLPSGKTLPLASLFFCLSASCLISFNSRILSKK